MSPAAAIGAAAGALPVVTGAGAAAGSVAMYFAVGAFSFSALIVRESAHRETAKKS